MKQTTNPNIPTADALEGLYQQWISLLRELRTASGEWRQALYEQLVEVHTETLTYAGVENVKFNPYYRLITHRPLSDHIILSRQTHNVI